MKKVGIALLGLGVVGSGTYRILQSKKESIKRDYGVEIEVKHVLEKDTSKAEALGISLAEAPRDGPAALRHLRGQRLRRPVERKEIHDGLLSV